MESHIDANEPPDKQKSPTEDLSRPLVHNKAPQALKTFAAHALHQATLWQIGRLGLQEAADGLRETAWRHQLVHLFSNKAMGEREIERIIRMVFEELGGDPSHVSHDL